MTVKQHWTDQRRFEAWSTHKENKVVPELTKPLLWWFFSTSVLVLPPSVISMAPAVSQLRVARGMGVMSAGQDLLKSSLYGLLPKLGLLQEHLPLTAHRVEMLAHVDCKTRWSFYLHWIAKQHSYLQFISKCVKRWGRYVFFIFVGLCFQYSFFFLPGIKQNFKINLIIKKVMLIEKLLV